MCLNPLSKAGKRRLPKILPPSHLKQTRKKGRLKQVPVDGQEDGEYQARARILGGFPRLGVPFWGSQSGLQFLGLGLRVWGLLGSTFSGTWRQSLLQVAVSEMVS